MRDGRDIQPEREIEERSVPRHVPILVEYLELDVKTGRLGRVLSLRSRGSGIRYRVGILTWL